MALLPFFWVVCVGSAIALAGQGLLLVLKKDGKVSLLDTFLLFGFLGFIAVLLALLRPQFGNLTTMQFGLTVALGAVIILTSQVLVELVGRTPSMLLKVAEVWGYTVIIGTVILLIIQPRLI